MKYILTLLAVSLMFVAAPNMAWTDQPREGVEFTIRVEDIADLFAWAVSSKTQLEDGLKRITKLPTSERRTALRSLMDSVVSASGVKNTELLMRVVMNRALTFDEVLTATSKATSEQESLGRRLLKDGAILALQVYVDDAEFLDQAKSLGQKEIPLDLPIATVGIKLASEYAKRSMQAPSHKATLEMLKLTMGLLFNDLNKSSHRRLFATVLNRIAEFSKTMEGKNPATPEEFLGLNRKIKAFLDEQIAEAAKVSVPGAVGGGVIIGIGGGTNSLGMEFVAISPGSFIMGSPTSERGRESDETRHRVTLTRGFEMQKTTVTQEQWAGVMGSNPSLFQEQENCPETYKVVNGVAMCPRHPVERVSWNEAQLFITRLNEAKRDGYTYRLPTEAEWEYAARAGSTTAYSFGDNPALLSEYAWFSDISGSPTHEVATRKPNAWGLYDMHGNVWQWVVDWYQSDLGSSNVVDPYISNGSDRVLRGGGWYDIAQSLRSANRFGSSPDARYGSGVRLVRIKSF